MSTMPPRVLRRALAVCGGALVGLFLVFLAAVHTAAGQRFEDGVLVATEAASHDRTRVLSTISGWSFATAVIGIVGIALARRQVALAVAAVGVVAGCVVTAEAVQRSIVRPILLQSGYRRDDQSFPSGHAAVAAAVLSGLAVVVPYRWRLWALVPASVWACAVTVATVTASWHRPSDTVGSDLISLLYVSAAVAVLARRGLVRDAGPRTPVGRAARSLVVGGYATVAAVAYAVAVVGSAFAAGRAIALAGTLTLSLVLLALLRHVELAAPLRPDE